MGKNLHAPKSIRFGERREELIEADRERLGVSFHQWVLRACDAMLPRQRAERSPVDPKTCRHMFQKGTRFCGVCNTEVKK